MAVEKHNIDPVLWIQCKKIALQIKDSVKGESSPSFLPRNPPDFELNLAVEVKEKGKKPRKEIRTVLLLFGMAEIMTVQQITDYVYKDLTRDWSIPNN